MKEDELLQSLRELPPREPPPELAARVERNAVATMTGEKSGAAYVFSRFVLPVVLAGAVGVYLTWAVQVSTALYR